MKKFYHNDQESGLFLEVPHLFSLALDSSLNEMLVRKAIIYHFRPFSGFYKFLKIG